ncbi:MAG: hypothetical protein CSA79_02115 [Thiothrix nivea]|nr:MAG: hypothetical protein CSA79_02115 [Thiothrix nivea]
MRRAVLQIAELTGQVQGYPLQAAGAVRVDGKRLSAENLQIHVGENRLGLNGQTDELSGINWELVAPDLKTLHPELAGKLQGKGNVKGLLDGSRLALRIEELTGQVKEYPLQAAGEVRLADQVLTANNLRLNVGRNRVLLDGAANTDKGVRWRVDAPALAELAPGLQGQLKGNGKLSGRLDGSQFAVEVAQLSGRVNGFPLNAQGGLSRKKGGFAVDDLQVSLGQNRVRLDGRVNQRQGIHWRLNAPRLADINPSLRGSLQGKGAIRGLTDDSQLSVQIVQLNGRVMDYPLSASGHVSLQGQRLSANKLLLNVGENTLNLNGVLDEQTGLGWSLNAPKLVQLSPALDGQLKGRGHLKGDLEAALMTLNIAELNGRVRGFPVNALGTVQLRDKKQLQLSQLRLNVGANAVRLNGSLDEVRGIDWQLDARKLVQLNPALDGQLRGHGHLKGALESSRFAVRVNTLTGRVRQYPVQLSGEVTSDGKNVTAHNVLLNSGQNTVKLNGSLGKSAGLDWQLDARNIGQLVPGVKASAKGNGTLSGQLDGPNLTVQVARLSGQVDGRPLTARGAVSLRGEKISLAGVQVSAGGNNQLALQGDVSEPLNLSWKINGRNLAQAWPGLAGGLQGEGTVRGTLARPQLKGFLKGSNVRYQDTSVQALDINISQSGAEYHVQGVLRNLQQGDHVLTHAEIKGQGTVERHSGTLAAVHKDGKLNVSVSGGLKGGRWDGAVNTLALRDTVAGDWQLTAPIRMSASDKAVTVTNSCLVNRQNARLCTQADWSAPGGLVAKGQLQQIPLAMARSFLPDNIQLPGRVSADYQFEQRGGKPFARVNVQLPDNVMVVVSKRGRKDTFRYTNARADLVLNNRNATIEARLDVVGHGQLRTQGQVILSPENNQHRVDLRTTLNMPSITRLQRFSPQVDALKGSVTGDVRVAGLLNRPQVTGALRLQNGSLYLPETGSRLNDINLTVQANRADQLSINGTLRAGSGQLTANGTLRLAQLPDWSADVRIAGQDLLLMNSHEIQAKVSPDLNVKAGPQSVVITGTVRIPETTVTLRELPSSASVRSDDIVIVGKGRPQPRKVTIAPDSGKPLYIRPDVMIELGERVSFSGFGLDARMTGRMRLLRNRQDIVAEGRLNVIDGVYKAYGQNLKIERGRLLFSGPVDNPGLDVRATREVENDITVGIAVNGTVRNPESSLFSTPPQTQTDTLSYLLTGHALSGVKGAESAILSQAVTGLGLSGGESLAQQLGGSLGLDDVGLNATGGDYKQSELSLGKRLGPKLYVKYIVGLFDSLQKIAVTYDINKKLQLEATSGIQQSVDLIYKIDTNRGPFGN